MQTKSLKDVFAQSAEMLKSELRRLMLPRDYQQIQKVINNHITTFLREDNEFISSLNASDAKLLDSILRMSLSFQALTLSDKIDYIQASKKTEYDFADNKGKETNDIIENTITLLPTVISAFFSPWLALAVGSGTIFGKQVISTSNNKTTTHVVRRHVDISKPLTENIISNISDAIGNICQEIDNVINKIRRDRSELQAKYQFELDNKSLEKMYPQILVGMQYLFMENLNKEQKNPNVENMMFQLGVYGYKIIQHSSDNDGFFSHKVKVGIDVPEMYLPAIIKEEGEGRITLAAEGIVFVPKYN